MKGEQEKNKIEKEMTDCIPAETKKAFMLLVKSGVYKELHKRNLISDTQLNSLLKDK